LHGAVGAVKVCKQEAAQPITIGQCLSLEMFAWKPIARPDAKYPQQSSDFEPAELLQKHKIVLKVKEEH
jgi:hypothetical protein